MCRRSTNRKACLYLISAMVLLVGLGSALFIYLTAEETSGDLGYQIIGGKIYPLSGDSKKYIHDLKVYGGEAAVLADRIHRWFLGLWQGTSLAYTVACIATFVSFIFFLVARYSPSHTSFDGGTEQHRDA